MEIQYRPEDYEVVTKHDPCPFHRKDPTNQSYAGCTCFSSIGYRKKGIDKKPKPEIQFCDQCGTALTYQ